MKQQKLADNIGLKEKKLSHLRNNKGFSLVELMVTTVIGAIVSMAIASVFIFTMEQFTIMVEKSTAEENSMMMMYYLRNYLSQGVDVYAVDQVTPGYVPTNCAITPGCNATGAGQVDINYQLLLPGSWGAAGGGLGAYSIFAAFNREAGTYNTNTDVMATAGSMLRTTGIFVKDALANGLDPDTRSGALFFDHGSNGAPMIPTANDLNFSRLHNFRVQRIPAGAANCAGGYAVEVIDVTRNSVLLPCLPAGWSGAAGIPAGAYKIKTITLEIMTRYFKSFPKSEWNYRFPTGGGTTASYKDITQTVKINFKNNTLTTNSLTGNPGEERVHGSLYFFDFMMPHN